MPSGSCSPTQEADELEQAEAKFNATADAPTDPKTQGRGSAGELRPRLQRRELRLQQFLGRSGHEADHVNGERRSSMIVDPPNGTHAAA